MSNKELSIQRAFDLLKRAIDLKDEAIKVLEEGITAYDFKSCPNCKSLDHVIKNVFKYTLESSNTNLYNSINIKLLDEEITTYRTCTKCGTMYQPEEIRL